MTSKATEKNDYGRSPKRQESNDVESDEETDVEIEKVN